ncbi:MAPEG family protein [Pseudemcibacter aquimaris]|uniref:MAPEG family protein n=1 Tax=Pseudemcibacter aquimaris TaxID=2857064 RepID=UPI0020112E8E|nr:MAPEG family protein [Pseudemcibacter aquimaris]MCC3859910.1 MAPEG family protein [Pseudemcibacter aquimaris]WDU57242.1 MAPEG family protein [Pseudemcibacter aquimaris]
MELVSLVILIALLEYIYFAVLVGKARGTYGVDAPATTGDETFERYYRVQMNTMELLVAMIPAMWVFATHVRADVAAYAGIVFIVGRFIYLKTYVADPKKRSLGFALSILPLLVLIIWGLVSLGMGMA